MHRNHTGSPAAGFAPNPPNPLASTARPYGLLTATHGPHGVGRPESGWEGTGVPSWRGFGSDADARGGRLTRSEDVFLLCACVPDQAGGKKGALPVPRLCTNKQTLREEHAGPAKGAAGQKVAGGGEPGTPLGPLQPVKAVSIGTANRPLTTAAAEARSNLTRITLGTESGTESGKTDAVKEETPSTDTSPKGLAQPRPSAAGAVRAAWYKGCKKETRRSGARHKESTNDGAHTMLPLAERRQVGAQGAACEGSAGG